MISSFFKLKSKAIDMARRQLNCSNRIKGKVISMIYQKHFPADLKKKEFFYRWKVRSNINHTRSVINRLVLHARIQPEIAFWRLRNLIKNPYDEHIIGKKLNQFEMIIQKTEKTIGKKNVNLAFQKLIFNLKRSKYMQRMVGEFEKKMNKLMKKIGLKALKQNEKEYDRLTKFQNGLMEIANKKIALFLTRLRQKQEQGEEKKKRSARNITEQSIDSHRRMIQVWFKQTTEDKQYKKCKLIMQFMEALNRQLQVNTLNQFETDRDQQLKKQAIEKMFGNFNQYARSLLKRWRVNAKMGSLNREMLKQMVKNLTSQIKNGDKGKLRSSLHQFYINMRVKKVQHNFFKGLFQTTAGSLLTIFQKWKNIPRRNLPSIIFQANLQRFSQRRQRPFLEQLKTISGEGEQTKKRAMQNMLNKTQSSSKRFFQDWKQMINTDKMIRKCKMTIKLFENIHQTIQSNTSLLLTDDSKLVKMRDAILKMFDKWKSNNNRYFYRWRKINQEYKINQLLKNKSYTEMIKRMVDFVKNSEGNSTKRALRQFQINSRIQQVKQRVFNKLLDTSAGKIINLFSRWKALPHPEPDNLQFKVRTVRFERMLHLFAQRPIKKSFQMLTDFQQDAVTIQNKAMITLLNKTMSSHKRMFINWANTSRTIRHQLKCRQTINLFNFMNQHMSNNLNSVVQHNREMQAKIKSIERLISNFKKYKVIAFQKWCGFMNVQKAEEEVEDELVKRSGLSRLEDEKQVSNDTKLSRCLEQFSNNLRRQKVILQMFKHVDRISNQNALNLLIRWKNLPDRSFPLQSNMFESKLSSKANIIVSTFLNRIQEVYQEGESKKRAAITRLVENQKKRQSVHYLQIN